jgi:hypothetical protein
MRLLKELLKRKKHFQTVRPFHKLIHEPIYSNAFFIGCIMHVFYTFQIHVLFMNMLHYKKLHYFILDCWGLTHVRILLQWCVICDQECTHICQHWSPSMINSLATGVSAKQYICLINLATQIWKPVAKWKERI